MQGEAKILYRSCILKKLFFYKGELNEILKNEKKNKENLLSEALGTVSHQQTPAPLVTCTEEQHSIIRFLVREGVKPIEIHISIKLQYGNACLLLQRNFSFEWFICCVEQFAIQEVLLSTMYRCLH